ncbi:MAG: SDR family oxidoreductase [Anaerolineae bacterium]|nr:MAG: SDR family oxidoreductase [Anaerolineae bacterium]
MTTIPQNRLNGQVALVTGASRGIGRSIALALAAHGAGVALVARDGSRLTAIQEEIEARGGRALAIPTDLAREEAIQACVRRCIEAFTRLDILVNNAGIGVFGPLERSRTQDWDRVMAVNARAPYILCREALPYLRQHPPSFIINISSVVGVKGYARQTIYSASKHALMGLTKALAREVQEDGIRVHAICPGGVATDMIQQARPDLDPEVLMQPEEIADIVLFLVTRRGRAVIDQVDVRRAASTPWG